MLLLKVGSILLDEVGEADILLLGNAEEQPEQRLDQCVDKKISLHEPPDAHGLVVRVETGDRDVSAFAHHASDLLAVASLCFQLLTYIGTPPPPTAKLTCTVANEPKIERRGEGVKCSALLGGGTKVYDTGFPFTVFVLDIARDLLSSHPEGFLTHKSR